MINVRTGNTHVTFFKTENLYFTLQCIFLACTFYCHHCAVNVNQNIKPHTFESANPLEFDSFTLQ